MPPTVLFDGNITIIPATLDVTILDLSAEYTAKNETS